MENADATALLPETTEETLDRQWERVVGRRSFLRGLGIATAALSAAMLTPSSLFQTAANGNPASAAAEFRRTRQNRP